MEMTHKTYRIVYPELPRALKLSFRPFPVRKSALLLCVLSLCTFGGAFYYVEQQIRLRTMNYDIIALKQQKNILSEQHKTLRLQLDQAKRLDHIETNLMQRGFVPVAEENIRLVP